MDELIDCIVESTNRSLESSSEQWKSDIITTCLVNIRNRLPQLYTPELENSEQTRLFCRQLKRLLANNHYPSYEFWIKVEDDILYILNAPNGRRDTVEDANPYYFIKRMEFERKLVKRELQFQQLTGKRKSLSELICEHKKFFEEYLQTCISFHSKVQVQGLIDNIDDLLGKVYGLTDVSLTFESRKRLRDELKRIEVNLDYSDRSFQNLSSEVSQYDETYKMDNNLNNFLPSQQENIGRNDHTLIGSHNESWSLPNILGFNRWIVIRGDPGSGKTALLQWMTRTFAQMAIDIEKQEGLKKDGRLPVRIPILIRMREFASWFEQHHTKTLMDYIGKHTWFSRPYCYDNDEDALKQLIYHGHALILLDGLDEILDVRRRKDIVDIVEEFISKYVLASDFVSAFDDELLKNRSGNNYCGSIETEQPGKSGGNQFIVTSRIVGYDFCPLTGPFIRHYRLLWMSYEQANEFVINWIKQVEKGVMDVLTSEKIVIDEETIENISKKRSNILQTMFKESSYSLMSNPLMLSIICTLVFKLSNEFYPQSRVKMYNYLIQSTLHSWSNQEPIISENMLNNFLINLATYLHLQSPSGLIDAYDMYHLCRLTLKQQNVSDDRTVLTDCATRLIALLKSNNGIVDERGLEIFGFPHLSFQEYFVAKALIKGSSIEDVVRRILSFTVNPRFLQSILFALGWISSEYSPDDYDKFCNLLITPVKQSDIPFGILLLCGAINDLQRLPSNTIIFTALNILLDHPFSLIRTVYFLLMLSNIHKDIILEWMQLFLQDDQYLLKFCQSISVKPIGVYERILFQDESIWPMIYRQLWSLHHRSSSAEFIINQTYQRTMLLDDISDSIFNEQLTYCFRTHNICTSNIHPLVLSVIVAVCGGIYVTKSEKRIINLDFSLTKMHGESSIIRPIVEYLTNTEESHLTKVQTLIGQYESVLQKSPPSDTSIDTIDAFIALICLEGLSQPLIYQKYDRYQALPLALERFKRTWFYFNKLCNPNGRDQNQGIDISPMISDIELIMKMLSSQYNKSDERCVPVLVVCASAWKKLGAWYLANQHNVYGGSYEDKLDRYISSQPEFMHFIREKELDQIADNIRLLDKLKDKSLVLITFLPQSLQQLYYCMTVASRNEKYSLPLVVLLSECLLRLEIVDNYDWNYRFAELILQPILKAHMLENYALVLFRERCSNTGDLDVYKKRRLMRMKRHKLMESFNYGPRDLEIIISAERQRIQDSLAMVQNQEKDTRLFATSISLARLFQGRYRSQELPKIKLISVIHTESEEVYFVIRNLFDPVLRIIALSIILEMKDSAIFDEKQRDKLQCEIVLLLQYLLPTLPFLILVLLYIHCHTARQMFPISFQHIANVIGEKLNESSTDAQPQVKEAAYLALRQLDDLHLSQYLSEFAKRKKNLSDLLHFNSTIFHQYFTNATSFDPLNIALLSSMYLVELAFDAQIFKIYIKNGQKNEILPLEELQQLWNESSKSTRILSFKVATWITNHLQILNKSQIKQIIKDMCGCVLIETKALSEIEKWLDYRMDKYLSFFTYYAALQLLIKGLDIPGLFDIIKEMFNIDKEFRLISLVHSLLGSQVANSTILRQVLIILQRNIRYSSKICVQIEHEETLKLILNLELERITFDIHGSLKTTTNPFLVMIRIDSTDLLNYILEHLCSLINKQTEIRNSIKEEYVAVVIKWITDSSLWYETAKKFLIELHNYFFKLLHDQRFPQIQKIIVNAINSKIIHQHVFGIGCLTLRDDTINNLEKVICSWNIYSEDVVALCLLAYGNHLLHLQRNRNDRKIPDKVRSIFAVLLEKKPFSEVVSIRAGFCLIFAEDVETSFSTISDWFEKNWNITPMKKYKILLQQTLFDTEKKLYSVCEYENSDYFRENYAELIETFIIDLYNYLCSNNNDYLSPIEPDYVRLAQNIIEINLNGFYNAVQRSTFGEKEFKKQLSLYFKKNPKEKRILIGLYIIFGTVTSEFLDMLQYLDDDDDHEYMSISSLLNNLKQVSDRYVIERLFELISLKISSGKKFKYFTDVLQSFIKMNAVSMLEVQQRLSLINNMFHNDNNQWCDYEEDVFQLLLDVSWFKFGYSKENFLTEKFFVKRDINEEFEKELQKLDKNLPLLLPKDFFA